LKGINNPRQSNELITHVVDGGFSINYLSTGTKSVLNWSHDPFQLGKGNMSRRAALAGAALAAGASALITVPASADTIEILSFLDAGCCSVSDGSKLQNGTVEGDPAGAPQRPTGEQVPALDDRRGEAGEPATVSEVVDDRFERAGDSLGPDAVALKVSNEAANDSPDGVSSVAAPEPSVLTRLLLIFADLRATVLRGP
jgi:hypothetical protein